MRAGVTAPVKPVMKLMRQAEMAGTEGVRWFLGGVVLSTDRRH